MEGKRLQTMMPLTITFDDIADDCFGPWSMVLNPGCGHRRPPYTPSHGIGDGVNGAFEVITRMGCHQRHTQPRAALGKRWWSYGWRGNPALQQRFADRYGVGIGTDQQWDDM